jgi:hypothetical protein
MTSLGECLEAAAGFSKQLLGHRQIALRSRQVLVTQVARQLGQQVVQVGACAIPGDNAMDSRRVAPMSSAT